MLRAETSTSGPGCRVTDSSPYTSTHFIDLDATLGMSVTVLRLRYALPSELVDSWVRQTLSRQLDECRQCQGACRKSAVLGNGVDGMGTSAQRKQGSPGRRGAKQHLSRGISAFQVVRR